MSSACRRGFTLVELTVALIMIGLVGAVTFRLLLNSQRVSRGQHARVRVQDNVRTGAIVAANELREIGYDSVPPTAAPDLVGALGSSADSDLLLAEPGRVWYRAMRGFGVTCAVPTTARLELRRTLYAGARDPQPGDSLTIFVEGDPALGSDDSWVRARVASVGHGRLQRRQPGARPEPRAGPTRPSPPPRSRR